MNVCFFNLYNEFQCSRGQRLNVHALMTTLHSKASTKPLLRNIEFRLGIIEPSLGRIEPCFGSIKAAKGLNTNHNLGNVFRIARKSAFTKLKTPLIDDTSAKLWYIYVVKVMQLLEQ